MIIPPSGGLCTTWSRSWRLLALGPVTGSRSSIGHQVANRRQAIHAEGEQVPLDGRLDAYHRLHRGEVVGRVVVTTEA